MSLAIRAFLRGPPTSPVVWRGRSTWWRTITTKRETERAQATGADQIRLSKLLSQHALNLTISRNTANKLIEQGEVTWAGEVVRSPQMLIQWKDLRKSGSVVVKVQGKGIQFDPDVQKQKNSKPVVYAVHKLNGEVVTENDPQNRPSMMKRLVQGGVGRKGKNKNRQQMHLKPIGRLDMPTEGLILVTNDGDFAREMELPANRVHRVYRARVHGRMTATKLNRIRTGGVRYQDTRYGPMQISIESKGRKNPNQTSTNTWVQITTTEGKNRQIRNVFAGLGMTVTRLIRIAYGDYSLQTIPAGMAIEVPYKPIARQKARGFLPKLRKTNSYDRASKAERATVSWISAS